MAFNNVIKFKCSQCGSSELGYQKYIKCLTPVTIKEEGLFEYGPSEINEDDYYLCRDYGFICWGCKSLIKHCGDTFKAENILVNFLTADPEFVEAQQQVYEKNLPDYDNFIVDEDLAELMD